jgi:hypothetical protein
MFYGYQFISSKTASAPSRMLETVCSMSAQATALAASEAGRRAMTVYQSSLLQNNLHHVNE